MRKNKKQINSFKVGVIVLLHNEGIDHSSADPVSLVCIILEKKDILFKLGCEAGVLDTRFALNVIEKTDLVTLFTSEQIPN